MIAMLLPNSAQAINLNKNLSEDVSFIETTKNETRNNSQIVREFDEIVLTFSYQTIGRVYISALYDYERNTFMLPVIEIFDRLEIIYRRGGARGLLEGTYLAGGERYSMNFADRTITLGDRIYRYDADNMMVGASDYYIDASVFEEVFNMRFETNMSTLSTRLITSNIMPVADRLNREQRRKNIERLSIERSFYPLRHPRKHNIIGGGFLDYQLSTTGLVDDPSRSFNYAFTGAGEFLGGGLQGNLAGAYTEDGGFSYRTDNVRWRYALNPNPFLTEINVGQISTQGLAGQRIRGLSITNDPIESRQLFGSYIVDGRTEPDSEVELYLNNNLIDFTVADQLGYYRFDVPLRFGTSRVETRIITPDGDLRTRDREIIVPFLFLPVGTVGYSAEGGITDGIESLLFDDGIALHGNVGYGLTEWLTARVGVDYNEIENSEPIFYSSASARIFGSYLINAEAVPNAFYRLQSTVVFPTSHSLSTGYTYFDGESRFNRRGAKQQITASGYTPLSFINSGFRAGIDAIQFQNRTEARITSDFFTRIGKLNFRLNYRDQLQIADNNYELLGGQIRTSVTYNISRNVNTPAPLRGTFVRATALYDMRLEQIRQLEMQLSRGLGRTGRFTFGVTHLLPTDETVLQFGLNLDLNGRLRSSTDYRSRSGTHTYRQTFRGSVGLDTRNQYAQLNDRQQAGRSAATITLFVDNSATGTFEPEKGDEILPYNAIRIDRSSQARIGSDGKIRLTQLESFYRYNVQINRNNIPNAMIAPAIDNFSFVTDPNNYKQIEIPFYRTGVIEGQVSILRNGILEGRGGLRLFIKGLDNNFNQTIRTLHGGGFYALDMPPGRYTMEVDPVQLDFLDVVARDGVLNFRIETRPEGHFLSDLEHILIPVTDEKDSELPLAVDDNARKLILAGILIDYHDAFRLFTEAQQALFTGRYADARNAINRSLALFESDYGIALKGSIEFMLGNREEAERLWLEAKRRNQAIELPDVDVLLQILKR